MGKILEIQGPPPPDEEPPKPSEVPLEQGIGRAAEGDVQVAAGEAWQCEVRSFRKIDGQVVKVAISAGTGQRIAAVSVYIDGFRKNVPYLPRPLSAWKDDFPINTYSPGSHHKCEVTVEAVDARTDKPVDTLTWPEGWVDA